MNTDLFVVQGTQTKAGLWAPLMEELFAAAQEPNRMLKNSKLSSSSEIFWLRYLHTIDSLSFHFLWSTILIVTNSFFTLKITTVRYSCPSLMFRLSISEHKTEQCFGNSAKAPRLVGYSLAHGSKCGRLERSMWKPSFYIQQPMFLHLCLSDAVFRKKGHGTC